VIFVAVVFVVVVVVADVVNYVIERAPKHEAI
jgi:hypothetical protein